MILFILGVIGMTLIITESEIMEPIHEWAMSHSRWLDKLMSCNQCCGFWCGLLFAPLVTTSLLPWFACGCAGSFLTQLGWSILEYLECDDV
jgi:hypothetical protein